MERRLIPHAVVVTRCRIKHSSLALIAHPRPGFFLALLQNHTIVAMIVVHIGLIPRGKSLIATHDGVFVINRFRLKHAIGVRFETSPDKLDELGRPPVASRCAMDWQKALAALDVIHQRFELLRRHGLILLPIAIHHHGIEMTQGLRLKYLRRVF